jgi:phosphate transport system substrate-binding protein
MKRCYVFALLSALGLSSCAIRRPIGAGATLPDPLYQECIVEFVGINRTMPITYNAVGSWEGIRRFRKGALDFAASDWPLDHSEAKLQIPTVVGAVVPIYSVTVARTLRFTPELLARIFSGSIRRWDDALIRRDNPGIKLPSAEIVVVHRSDGSGTTHILANFFVQHHTSWKGGNDFRVTWPSWSTGVEGNEKLAETVAETPNAIGYVEYAYATEHPANYGAVQNRAGQFVRASVETISAAVPIEIPDNEDPVITQQRFPLARDPEAYPITGFTWLLIPDKLSDRYKRPLVTFLKYMLQSCQNHASPAGYVPLPEILAQRYRDKIVELAP